MLIRPITFELTLKKVRMGERCAGVPEECWVIRYERPEPDEHRSDEDRERKNGPSGGYA